MALNMGHISKKSIAYHEAGHTVAYWALTGRTPVQASIEPSIGYLGHVKYKSLINKKHLDIGRRDQARVKLEHSIMIKLAGPIAQQRISGVSGPDCTSSSDWLSAVDLALRQNDNESKAFAYIGWLEYKTTDLLEHHWQLVKRVANWLLKHKKLHRAELQKIFGAAVLLLLVYIIPIRARIRNEVSNMIAPISVCCLGDIQAVTCRVA